MPKLHSEIRMRREPLVVVRMGEIGRQGSAWCMISWPLTNLRARPIHRRIKMHLALATIDESTHAAADLSQDGADPRRGVGDLRGSENRFLRLDESDVREDLVERHRQAISDIGIPQQLGRDLLDRSEAVLIQSPEVSVGRVLAFAPAPLHADEIAARQPEGPSADAIAEILLASPMFVRGAMTTYQLGQW